MRTYLIPGVLGAGGLFLAGCSTPLHSSGPPLSVAAPAAKAAHVSAVTTEKPDDTVLRASAVTAVKSDGDEVESSVPTAFAESQVTARPAKAPGAGLPALIGLTLERNPRLAQVSWAVEAARGRAEQAGLYPNPTLSVTGDELGDRTGPGGIWTAPYFSQEIVTGNKLGLSKAVALKEVDQAALTVVAERYRVITDVRQNYFEAATLQRRADILGDLIGLAEKAVENANQLLKAQQGSELDVVQLEVDLERYRAELNAANRSLPAALRRLAASMGVQDLPSISAAGDLDAPLPAYDLERVRAYVAGIHPELRSAQIGVERAQLAVQRAAAEPVPNVTLGAGYVRQNQNKSNDWVIAASLPVPVWNRNQGNVFAAKAQVGEAVAGVGRVQNDLDTRLAGAFAAYAAARERADKYKAAILPKAEQSYQLSLKAYRGGQFEYLRVLQSQRAVAEARLENVRSQGEAWRAASDIAGLMLEDTWPAAPAGERGRP